MSAPTQTLQRQAHVTERVERAERRADLLVRMLQGTMALEGQALPPSSLERLKKLAVEKLLAQ